jgi:hypothetical protein
MGDEEVHMPKLLLKASYTAEGIKGLLRERGDESTVDDRRACSEPRRND